MKKATAVILDFENLLPFLYYLTKMRDFNGNIATFGNVVYYLNLIIRSSSLKACICKIVFSDIWPTF